MSHRLILNVEVVGSLILPCLSLWLVDHHDRVLHSNGSGVILIFPSFTVSTAALYSANRGFDLITNSTGNLFCACAPRSGKWRHAI